MTYNKAFKASMRVLFYFGLLFLAFVGQGDIAIAGLLAFLIGSETHKIVVL